MNLYPSWRTDPRLISIVASFEIQLGDRLSVVAICDTGVPLFHITSAKPHLRKKARKIGLVWGMWPTTEGKMIASWIPSRTKGI